jgi:hypothetical protein
MAVVAVAVAVVWWQWPTITSQDERTDVVLLTDGFLTSTERPVTYRIREDGRSLRWDAEATSWCSAADAVGRIEAEYKPAAFVLSFGDATGCDAAAVINAVKAARGHTVLIVTQPGRSGIETAGEQDGATLIDPSRFVGGHLTATSMPCQWWETCTADGTIAVRTAGGSLTAEGGDRIARMIVAELP